MVRFTSKVIAGLDDFGCVRCERTIDEYWIEPLGYDKRVGRREATKTMPVLVCLSLFDFLKFLWYVREENVYFSASWCSSRCWEGTGDRAAQETK
jgi:hypothetical protein